MNYASCDGRKFAGNVCIEQHAQRVIIWSLILLLFILLFLLMIMPFVPLKRRLKSQCGGRTVFNLITQFDLKYKETTWVLSLTSVQNKQKINCDNLEINWKLTSWLPLYLWQIVTEAEAELNNWNLDYAS